MSNIFVTLKNIVAQVFYYCKFIGNHIFVEDFGNYARIIKKKYENRKFVSLA